MLTLQIPKTVTEEKTIPVPCFWRNGIATYGFINDENLYVVAMFDNYHSIINCTPQNAEERFKTYFDKNTEIITEAQFFSAYDEARKATELQPQLITNSDRYVDMLETVGINQKEI